MGRLGLTVCVSHAHLQYLQAHVAICRIAEQECRSQVVLACPYTDGDVQV